MDVNYKNIESYPGYRVGDDGSVWSCRDLRGNITENWHRLAANPSKRDGYPSVKLSNRGRSRCYRVHELVLIAFIGPRPCGCEACHFPNRDRSDNRLVNLRWDTKFANQRDRAAHGTSNQGSRNPQSKFTESIIREIRSLADGGTDPSDLAMRFKTTRKYIFMVLRKVRWRHVC